MSEPIADSLNDGPYYFYLNDSIIKSINIKEDRKDTIKIEESQFNIKDSAKIQQKPKNPIGFNPLDSFPYSHQVWYSANKIAVISDIHGSYNQFKSLLQANKIINDSLDWIWESGHLVILGDVFDKGAKVTECLWLIKKLEDQAIIKGGKVHFLLGNHEKLILNGTTTYNNIKYQKLSEKLLVNYSQLYGYNTYLGRWLRSKQVMIKINNNLFVHGGISRKMLDSHLTLSEINDYFRKWAFSENRMEYNNNVRDTIGLLINYFGPLEYRGYYNINIFNRGQSSKYPEEWVNETLKLYQSSRIIVGHTIVKEIKGLFDNKVIAVNTICPEDDELKNGLSSQILIIEGKRYYKAGISKGKTLLFSE